MDEKDKKFRNISYPYGRCNPCEYAKEVEATGQWRFLGCHCKPYRGKWVGEIKECPLEKMEG